MFSITSYSQKLLYILIIATINIKKIVTSPLDYFYSKKTDNKSDNNAVRSSRGFIIPYSYDCKKYSLILPIQKIKNWTKVTTESNIDITEEILNFAGPYKNFFGLSLTPKLLYPSCDSITFHFQTDDSDPSVLTFERNDIIQL